MLSPKATSPKTRDRLHLMPTLEAVATGFSIGVIIGLLTFGSNFGRPNDPTAKVLLSIVWSDLLFSITACIVISSAILNKGYVLGVSGCIANYYFILTSACASVLNLIIASVERYYAVVKGERWSSQTVNRILSVLWAYSLSQAFMPMLSHKMTAIRLEETGWSCLVTWYGRDWASLTLTIITSLVFAIGFSIVAYCYLSVYKTFSNAIHMQKKVTEAHIQKERRVFLMCLMLTGSFLLFWTPSAVNVTYEFITGTPLDPNWAIIPSLLSGIPTATNSMILLYFDNRIRGNVLKVLSRIRNFTKAIPEPEVGGPAQTQHKNEEKSIPPENESKDTKLMDHGQVCHDGDTQKDRRIE